MLIIKIIINENDESHQAKTILKKNFLSIIYVNCFQAIYPGQLKFNYKKYDNN
jgi:hypothetical protein